MARQFQGRIKALGTTARVATATGTATRPISTVPQLTFINPFARVSGMSIGQTQRARNNGLTKPRQVRGLTQRNARQSELLSRLFSTTSYQQLNKDRIINKVLDENYDKDDTTNLNSEMVNTIKVYLEFPTLTMNEMITLYNDEEINSISTDEELFNLIRDKYKAKINEKKETIKGNIKNEALRIFEEIKDPESGIVAKKIFNNLLEKTYGTLNENERFHIQYRISKAIIATMQQKHIRNIANQGATSNPRKEHGRFPAEHNVAHAWCAVGKVCILSEQGQNEPGVDVQTQYGNISVKSAELYNLAKGGMQFIIKNSTISINITDDEKKIFKKYGNADNDLKREKYLNEKTRSAKENKQLEDLNRKHDENTSITNNDDNKKICNAIFQRYITESNKRRNTVDRYTVVLYILNDRKETISVKYIQLSAKDNALILDNNTKNWKNTGSSLINNNNYVTTIYNINDKQESLTFNLSPDIINKLTIANVYFPNIQKLSNNDNINIIRNAQIHAIFNFIKYKNNFNNTLITEPSPPPPEMKGGRTRRRRSNRKTRKQRRN